MQHHTTRYITVDERHFYGILAKHYRERVATKPHTPVLKRRLSNILEIIKTNKIRTYET